MSELNFGSLDMLEGGSKFGSVGRKVDNLGGNLDGSAEDVSTAGLDDGAIGLDEISSVVGTQPKRKQMVNSVEIAEVKIFL